MEFKIGSSVLVVPLKQVGVIVERVSGGYRVEIGSITTRCKATDLRAAEPIKRTPRKNEIPSYSKAEQRALANLDLHGMTVDQAIAALESHINQAVLAGLDQVTVVHGIGSGRVKDAVYRRLDQLKVVRSFRQEMNNPGSTAVYL